MKSVNLIILIIFLKLNLLNAQVPQSFKYQALIRDAQGIVYSKKPIKIDVNILKTSVSGEVVYEETFSDTTNLLGLIDIKIGQGTALKGKFNEIEWSYGIYFMKVSVDIGTGYITLGTSQLLSVPYAINAGSLTLKSSDGKLWEVKVSPEGTLTTDCYPHASKAYAGSDQTDVSVSGTNLSGNTPSEGQGLWTIISGSGGTIVTPTSPTSFFSGLDSSSYVLRWTIKNNCDNNFDEVNISFKFPKFNCGDTLTDTRDGKKYTTVQIATQCWMKENLNTLKYISGDPIPNVTDAKQWKALTTGAYCDYNNLPSNSVTYGRLYNLHAALDKRLICPSGWHVPTSDEWWILINYLGGYPVSGGKMKEVGTTHWKTPNTGATNESDFTGLPGGYREYSDGTFNNILTIGMWWGANLTYNVLWYNYYTSAVKDMSNPTFGLSIRCLKN